MHWNIADTGWAKSAWSSLFAPWTQVDMSKSDDHVNIEFKVVTNCKESFFGLMIKREKVMKVINSNKLTTIAD